MFCNTGHNTYRNQGFKNRKFWLIDLFVQWKQLANCLKTVRTIRASVVVYILVKHWKTIVLKKNCNCADHGLGITDENHAKFGTRIGSDFGSVPARSDTSDTFNVYGLNLWVRTC